jgi:hypothetical protein
MSLKQDSFSSQALEITDDLIQYITQKLPGLGKNEKETDLNELLSLEDS